MKFEKKFGKKRLNWELISVHSHLRDPILEKSYLKSWLEEQKAGNMDWMYRNIDLRSDPEKVFEDTKTVIMFGLNYYQKQPENQRGVIATYALGRDYHKVLKKKIQKLGNYIEEELGGRTRSFVDTGPVMEKPLAAATGMGWQGKSTLLINKEYGTWLFLGELFTNLDLPHDQDITEGKGYCGKYTVYRSLPNRCHHSTLPTRCSQVRCLSHDRTQRQHS